METEHENQSEATPAEIKSIYDNILDNRKLEIELVWKRTNFFWLTNAAAFVAFYNVIKYPSYAIVMSNVGLFWSVCWTLANRGGKFWQRNWELWTYEYEKKTLPKGEPPVFRGSHDESLLPWWAHRFSVTKVLIACSDYMVVVWFFILISILLKYFMPQEFHCAYIFFRGFGAIVITGFTVIAIILMLILGKGKDR